MNSSGTVQNCYSIGSVSSTASAAGANANAGGVVGYFGGGTVKNSVALNSSVSGTGSGTKYVGRVVGKKGGGTLANNYAFSGISGSWNGADKGHAGIHGADVAAKTLFSPSFWTGTGNWDSGIWTIANDKLPVLTGLQGQSGDGGLYLRARDIQYATLATKTFIYNGSPQYPDLTFDGPKPMMAAQMPM